MISRRTLLAAVVGTGFLGDFVPFVGASTTTTRLPVAHDEAAIRFVVFGDAGSGSMAQYELAWQMEALRKRIDFGFVVMLGDQIYPDGDIEDVGERFVEPYFELLNAGVKFYPGPWQSRCANQRR